MKKGVRTTTLSNAYQIKWRQFCSL